MSTLDRVGLVIMIPLEVRNERIPRCQVNEPTPPTYLQVLLHMLHSVGMNLLFLVPLLIVVLPILGTGWYLAAEYMTQEPMLAAGGGVLGLGALASVFRVWFRVLV